MNSGKNITWPLRAARNGSLVFLVCAWTRMCSTVKLYPRVHAEHLQGLRCGWDRGLTSTDIAEGA